jgi:hypothetical protein
MVDDCEVPAVIRVGALPSDARELLLDRQVAHPEQPEASRRPDESGRRRILSDL